MVFFFFIGALTSKTYAFVGRKWELESFKSYNFFDSFGSLIEVFLKDLQVVKILPFNNTTTLFNYWLNDKIRFFFDSLFYQQNLIPIVKKKKKFIALNWFNVYNYFFFIKNSLYLPTYEKNYFKSFFFFEQFYNIFFFFKLKILSFCFFFCFFFFDFFFINKKNYNNLLDISSLNYLNLFSDNLYSLPIYYVSVFYNFRLENPSFSFFLFKIIKKFNIKLFGFGNQSFFFKNIFVKILGNSFSNFFDFLNFKALINPIKKKIKNFFFFFSSFLLNNSEYFYLFNKFLLIRSFLFNFYKITYKYFIIYNTLEHYNLLLCFFNFDYKNYFFFEFFFFKFLNFSSLAIFKTSLLFFFLLPSFFFFFNVFNIVLNKLKKNVFFIYHGSHFFYNFYFKLILPVSFFFEHDNFMINSFNKLHISKYIYAPKKKTVIDLTSILVFYEYLFFSKIFFYENLIFFFLNNILFKNLNFNYYYFFFNNFLFYLNVSTKLIILNEFEVQFLLKKILLKKKLFFYFNFFNYYLTNQITLISKSLNLASYRFYNLNYFFFN